MANEVSVRALRNNTTAVLRRVEAGERLRVTMNRRPVAELVPLPTRDVWGPRARVIGALVQADTGLRDDLGWALDSDIGQI